MKNYTNIPKGFTVICTSTFFVSIQTFLKSFFIELIFDKNISIKLVVLMLPTESIT